MTEGTLSSVQLGETEESIIGMVKHSLNQFWITASLLHILIKASICNDGCYNVKVWCKNLYILILSGVKTYSGMYLALQVKFIPGLTLQITQFTHTSNQPTERVRNRCSLC